MKSRESKRSDQVSELERLREAGDYAALSGELPADWQRWDVRQQQTIRLRLLVAGLRDHEGDLEGMSRTLKPYINRRDLIPFGLADRLIIAQGVHEQKQGNSAHALQLAGAVQAVSSTLENTFYVGEALQLQAEALWSLGRRNEAIDLFRQAAASYDEHKRYYRFALASARLGEVLYFTGRLEEARELLRRTIALLVDSPDRLTLASVRESLAELLNTTGDYDYAIEHLARAVEIYEELGDEPRLAQALAEISLTLRLADNHTEAASHLAQALGTAARMRVEPTSRFHETIARVYLELSDFTQAQIAVQRAIETAAASRMNPDKARARRTAGRLQLLQERYTEAALTLRLALDHSLQAKHKVLELEIEALLALASTSTDLLEATRLLTSVHAKMGELSLPQIRTICAGTRKRIQTAGESTFVISDRELPTIGEGHSGMRNWSWTQAIRKAGGDSSEAARIMGVSVSYVRKIGQLIRGGSLDAQDRGEETGSRTKQKPT